MAVSSTGLQPKSDCSGKAQKQLYSNLQTRPLVREGGTNLQNQKCLKEISKRKRNWSQVPDGRLTPGQTGRLTVGRKLTHSLTYEVRHKPLKLVFCNGWYIWLIFEAFQNVSRLFKSGREDIDYDITLNPPFGSQAIT
jgi:hypothetical protein